MCAVVTNDRDQRHSTDDLGRMNDQRSTTNLRVFVQILLLEAAIVLGLWWFGQAYS